MSWGYLITYGLGMLMGYLLCGLVAAVRRARENR
jgi:hypothetical protein